MLSNTSQNSSKRLETPGLIRDGLLTLDKFDYIPHGRYESEGFCSCIELLTVPSTFNCSPVLLVSTSAVGHIAGFITNLLKSFNGKMLALDLPALAALLPFSWAFVISRVQTTIEIPAREVSLSLNHFHFLFDCRLHMFVYHQCLGLLNCFCCTATLNCSTQSKSY